MNQQAIEKPIDMYGSLFDHYLENGYYRMQRNLFTTDDYFDTDTLCMFDVFWLRTMIQKLDSPRDHKIWKLNNNFRVYIGLAKYSIELDELYARYRNSMKFNAHESIEHFLVGDEEHCRFNSGLIEIRDKTKLIAAGYFDVGGNSITGNLNFYDPDYKKYSLGKYLMLRKIDFAKAHQFTYYYTGYLAVKNQKFDYKLFPDPNAVEVLIKQENNSWFPYTDIKKEGLIPYTKWTNVNELRTNE